jgi:hypothetical protein
MAVHPSEFEKDHDPNGHVDFLHAMANLRARCYGLPSMAWIDVRLKAGRIIPALVTTTAAVAGLLAAELVKLLAHGRRIGGLGAGGAAAGWPVDRFKSSFLNLAVRSPGSLCCPLRGGSLISDPGPGQVPNMLGGL